MKKVLIMIFVHLCSYYFTEAKVNSTGPPNLDDLLKTSCPAEKPSLCLPYGVCCAGHEFCYSGTCKTCFPKAVKEDGRLAWCKEKGQYNVTLMRHQSCSLACQAVFNSSVLSPLNDQITEYKTNVSVLSQKLSNVQKEKDKLNSTLRTVTGSFIAFGVFVSIVVFLMAIKLIIVKYWPDSKCGRLLRKYFKSKKSSSVKENGIDDDDVGSPLIGENNTPQPSGPNASGLNALPQPSGSNASKLNDTPQPSGSNATSFNDNPQQSGSNATSFNDNPQPSGSNASNLYDHPQPFGSNASKLNALPQPSGSNATGLNATPQPSGLNTTRFNENTQPSGSNATGLNTISQSSGLNATRFNENPQPSGSNASRLNATPHPSGFNATGFNDNPLPSGSNATSFTDNPQTSGSNASNLNDNPQLSLTCYDIKESMPSGPILVDDNSPLNVNESTLTAYQLGTEQTELSGDSLMLRESILDENIVL